MCQRSRSGDPDSACAALSSKAQEAKFPKAFEGPGHLNPIEAASNSSESAELSLSTPGSSARSSQILPRSQVSHGPAAAIFGVCMFPCPLH